MNKKLLFGIMSLAALAACTNDDFESQKVAEEASPVQFEVINGDDALTRASMNGTKIVWNAKDNDLFTLYHGAAIGAVNGYENATYKANAGVEGAAATLTTPSVIKQGGAIMVWPVDTAFRIGPANNLTLKIPATQTNIENNIPYVSDLLEIDGYAAYSETGAYPSAYRTAGKDRKYPIYMRPMASQLIVKADYVNTDATLAALYEGGSDNLTGDDAITPISLTSVDLLTQTGGATLFTTEIPLKFTAPTPAIQTQWNAVTNNRKNATNTVWNQVTDFDIANIAAAGQTNKLRTTVIDGTESCKFLILPQANMATVGAGVTNAGVVVNTYYGRVVIADNGQVYDNTNYGYLPVTTGAVSAYTAAEYAGAWYRYIAAAATLPADGETKAATATAGLGYKTTANVEMGLKQTINGFSSYTHAGTSPVQGEPEGASATRYLEVRLNHLDMSDLHIKSDKQLRDVVRVWKKLNLPDVTVLLDGTSNEFRMSQKAITLINQINAATTGKSFKVMPCQAAGEVCNTIVITGGGEVQNIAFIKNNGAFKADVALNAGETWSWPVKGAAANLLSATGLKVEAASVDRIINRGTLQSAASAILATCEGNGALNNVPFVNNGTWNITAGTLNVQFDVSNNGTLNIEKGAQYRQDGQAQSTQFINQATARPSRFGGNDSQIGKVNNKGVFATVAAAGKTATIDNYGLIEHADDEAKTYITTNQLGGAFGTAFGAANKMGRINLPYSNKNEDNVSVSAALSSGFISVTVDGEVQGALDASVVGSKVNYVIVKSGITEIKAVAAQVKYLEINQPGTELAWNVAAPTTYTGLMVLSDVNIKLGTTIAATVTYLGADMYVGGKFNINALATPADPIDAAATVWDGYYGNTASNVSSLNYS